MGDKKIKGRISHFKLKFCIILIKLFLAIINEKMHTYLAIFAVLVLLCCVVVAVVVVFDQAE